MVTKTKESEEVVSTLSIDRVYKADYRLKCWNYWKISTVVGFIGTGVSYLLSVMGSSALTSIVTGLMGLALTYFSVVFMINRFHDLGKSGWNVLLLLIPIYNIYLVILLSFVKGEKVDNEYGEYMDKQIIFNPAADKVFHILTILSLSFLGVILLGILLFTVFGVVMSSMA